MEVSSWEHHLFLWAIYTMAMLVITRGYLPPCFPGVHRFPFPKKRCHQSGQLGDELRGPWAATQATLGRVVPTFFWAMQLRQKMVQKNRKAEKQNNVICIMIQRIYYTLITATINGLVLVGKSEPVLSWFLPSN